jgi:C4-dicarboxylate-specific signal transduction histidine kinase
MRVATEQAAHVINSVKQMAISNQSWSKEVDLNATANDALAIVRSLTKKVALHVDLAPDLPLIEACPGELVQVWINLIKNAIESLINHKVPKPKLWISTSKSANHVMMTVRDNGIGIPADIIGRIYEPSFTTKVRGLSLGLGLGLTIVQRIVDEHVGSIFLDSKPGETIFNIRLKAPRS